MHQKVKNKGNHDASHDLRGDGCEKLPHGRTLLSEACPTAVLPEKAAAFKKTPPPGVHRRTGASAVCAGYFRKARPGAQGIYAAHMSSRNSVSFSFLSTGRMLVRAPR